MEDLKSILNNYQIYLTYVKIKEIKSWHFDTYSYITFLNVNAHAPTVSIHSNTLLWLGLLFSSYCKLIVSFQVVLNFFLWGTPVILEVNKMSILSLSRKIFLLYSPFSNIFPLFCSYIAKIHHRTCWKNIYQQ